MKKQRFSLFSKKQLKKKFSVGRQNSEMKNSSEQCENHLSLKNCDGKVHVAISGPEMTVSNLPEGMTGKPGTVPGTCNANRKALP